MREIRTYGSEGGAAGQPAVPTPISLVDKSLDPGFRRGDDEETNAYGGNPPFVSVGIGFEISDNYLDTCYRSKHSLTGGNGEGRHIEPAPDADPGSASTSGPRFVVGQSGGGAPVCAPSCHAPNAGTWSFPSAARK